MKKALISAVMLLAICTSVISCGSPKNPLQPTAQDKKIVMRVGGEDVEYQEFRYFFLNNKRDSFGADAVLSDEELNEVISLTEENSRQRHALIKMAEKYGGKLTRSEKKSAEEYIEQSIASFGSDEAYLIALDEQYLTDHLFREMTKEAGLAYTVLDKMKEAGAIIENGADFDKVLESDEIICIKEIYLTYNSEETKEIVRNRAEEVLSKLMSGANFEDMMREYSDYNEAELPPEHGYYTMKFDALDTVYDAAINLAANEHSYVVESECGFHIVMRCEKDSEYMETIRDEIYENYTYAKFSEEYEATIDAMEIVYTEYGAGLDLASMS